MIILYCQLGALTRRRIAVAPMDNANRAAAQDSRLIRLRRSEAVIG